MDSTFKSKFDQLLDVLERIISIIKPKTYNLLARVVVFLGAGLVAESQTHFLSFLFVAFIEYFFGTSELLRDYLLTSSDPTIGVILIFAGLFYHAIVTVGYERLQLRKPIYPEFVLSLTNGDGELINNNFTIRGNVADFKNIGTIPSYEPIEPEDSISYLTFANSFIQKKRPNRDLYRERAKLLKEWAGAELICLKILNNSEVLATGITIDIKIRNHEGLAVSYSDGNIPHISKEIDDTLSFKHDHSVSYQRNTRWFLSRDFFSSSLELERLRAKESYHCEECTLIKASEKFEIIVSLHCDQLSEAITFSYQGAPASETLNITSDDFLDDERFEGLCSDLIMDGYYDRLREKQLLEAAEMIKQWQD